VFLFDSDKTLPFSGRGVQKDAALFIEQRNSVTIILPELKVKKRLNIPGLPKEGTIRDGQLKKFLPSITHKMPGSHLKELEKTGLINRKV
jgi:DNA-binding HxlR family transcriptional regulator